eukprot:s2039_g6.t1
MLQCHSIRVLYDIRPTDYRGEFHSRHQRFSIASLRGQCRSRGVFFKSMPIGRESAYGTLAHVRSDEGRHTLVELAWQAKRKRTAFLGSEELWKDEPQWQQRQRLFIEACFDSLFFEFAKDNRQVIAEELVKAGHEVQHVRSDGSTEKHLPGIQYPDWLLREEDLPSIPDRLKLLEKKRQAGEAGEKVHKSRLERSSEAVAARLARPTEELDAMTELRLAANQRELVVAQRKLARYQRLADEKGLLANKVLKNVPEWVREDALKQAEWVAAKKKEKADAEASGASGVKEDLEKDRRAWLIATGPMPTEWCKPQWCKEATILGEDALAPERLYQKMFKLTANKVASEKGWSREAMIRLSAAVDLACWDIVGKAANLPLYKLFGKDEQELRDDLQMMVDQGHTGFKDMERLRVIREVIGEKKDLMVDVNRAWDFKTACEGVKLLEAFQPRWLEEPEATYNKGSGMIRSGGESENTSFGCRSLLEEQAISILQFDATMYGGFTEGRKLAALCELNHVQVAPHHDCFIHAQLVASSPAGLIVEAFTDPERDPLQAELYEDAPEIKDGIIKLSDAPGLGLTLNEKAIEKYGTQIL